MKTLFAFLSLLSACLGAAEVQTVRVGKTDVTVYHDCAARDVPLSLFGGVAESEMRDIATAGTVVLDRSVFSFVARGRLVLVDTGMGEEDGFLRHFLASGKRPKDVKAILITHAHQDHVGGLVRDDALVFPNAKIYISKIELEFWTQGKNADSATAKILKRCAKKIVAFDFDAEVLPGVWARRAVGHTPGHTVFETRDVFFIGDLLHGAALQFRKPEICASFDMEWPAAIDARKAWLAKAAESGTPVAGCHLPFPAIGKVATEGEGFAYEVCR